MNSADVILYILDYSKLKTEEEAQILQKLKSMRPDLIRDITNRLFIVVNKMDLVKKVSLWRAFFDIYFFLHLLILTPLSNGWPLEMTRCIILVCDREN